VRQRPLAQRQGVCDISLKVRRRAIAHYIERSSDLLDKTNENLIVFYIPHGQAFQIDDYFKERLHDF
jgi:hypothetical protein